MEGAAATMLTNISTAFTTVLGWGGDIVTALSSGELADLGVLFGIGVAMAVIGGVLGLIKRIIWGA